MGVAVNIYFVHTFLSAWTPSFDGVTNSDEITNSDGVTNSDEITNSDGVTNLEIGARKPKDLSPRLHDGSMRL